MAFSLTNNNWNHVFLGIPIFLIGLSLWYAEIPPVQVSLQIFFYWNRRLYQDVIGNYDLSFFIGVFLIYQIQIRPEICKRITVEFKWENKIRANVVLLQNKLISNFICNILLVKWIRYFKIMILIIVKCISELTLSFWIFLKVESSEAGDRAWEAKSTENLQKIKQVSSVPGIYSSLLLCLQWFLFRWHIDVWGLWRIVSVVSIYHILLQEEF